MLTINEDSQALGKALRRVLDLLSENDDLKLRCSQLEEKYFKLKAEHEAYTARHRDRPDPFSDMGGNH